MWRNLSLLLAVFVSVCMPLALSMKSVQNSFALKGKSPLYELSQWDEVFEGIGLSDLQAQMEPVLMSMPSCRPHAYASLRWYWVSQLNFRAGKQLFTSLDPNYRSYYDYIRPTDQKRMPGCCCV